MFVDDFIHFYVTSVLNFQANEITFDFGSTR